MKRRRNTRRRGVSFSGVGIDQSAPMPMVPSVAEDIALPEKYPDLTATQSSILKSAACYLMQDEMDSRNARFKADDIRESSSPRTKPTSSPYSAILARRSEAEALGDAEPLRRSPQGKGSDPGHHGRNGHHVQRSPEFLPELAAVLTSERKRSRSRLACRITGITH